MKGKHLVIGLVIFVLVIVGLIYYFMMGTINNIKEEQEVEESISELPWKEISLKV